MIHSRECCSLNTFFIQIWYYWSWFSNFKGLIFPRTKVNRVQQGSILNRLLFNVMLLHQTSLKLFLKARLMIISWFLLSSFVSLNLGSYYLKSFHWSLSLYNRSHKLNCLFSINFIILIRFSSCLITLLRILL